MTEVALSNYLSGYQVDLELEKIHFVPFNSVNKYSLVQVRGNHDFCLIKGAPDKLVAYAQEYFDAAGNVCALTAEAKQALDKQMITFAENSIRMLGLFAYPDAIEGDKLPEEGLRLIGIACIRDDIRPEAVEAIGEVQSAGVQVVMITGDRKETAVAIAKDAGILREPTDIVWTSDELAGLGDEQVKAWCLDSISNLKTFMADRDRTVEKRLAELNKPIQAKIKEKVQLITDGPSPLSVERVTQNSELLPSYIIKVWLPFKVLAPNIKSVRGTFLIYDSNKKVIFSRDFDSGNADLSKSKDGLWHFNNSWPLNSYDVKDKEISTCDLSQTTNEVIFTGVSFNDGTEDIECYNILPAK